MEQLPRLSQPVVIEESGGEWTASIVLPFAIAGEQPVLGHGDDELAAVEALRGELEGLRVASADGSTIGDTITAFEIAQGQITFELTGTAP